LHLHFPDHFINHKIIHPDQTILASAVQLHFLVVGMELHRQNCSSFPLELVRRLQLRTEYPDRTHVGTQSQKLVRGVENYGAADEVLQFLTVGYKQVRELDNAQQKVTSKCD
jgi:hypothetical protein